MRGKIMFRRKIAATVPPAEKTDIYTQLKRELIQPWPHDRAADLIVAWRMEEKK